MVNKAPIVHYVQTQWYQLEYSINTSEENKKAKTEVRPLQMYNYNYTNLAVYFTNRDFNKF